MSDKYRFIPLCDEDILNLKNAKQRILDTLNIDNYEALEIFTINHIIEKYEEQKKDEL